MSELLMSRTHMSELLMSRATNDSVQDMVWISGDVELATMLMALLFKLCSLSQNGS